MSVNVQIIGHLGADAEIRQTRNGNNFVSFSMATDEYKNGKNETTWLNVVDYGTKTSKMQPYLKKGSHVVVFGVETVSVYTDRNGMPQISRDVRADRVDFVNGDKSQQNNTVRESATSNTVIADLASKMSCTVNPSPTVSPSPTMASPQIPTPIPTPQVASEIQDDIDDLPF